MRLYANLKYLKTTCKTQEWLLLLACFLSYGILSIVQVNSYLAISIMYTERKKKRRVNFIPKFHLSLKKFVKYFTMITKRYMYGTKVPNFIGL